MSQAKDRVIDVTKFKLEADGSFKRPDTVFRSLIEKGGKLEPEASKQASLVLQWSPFLPVNLFDAAMNDRAEYKLPLVLAWAVRTLISRKLKGLEDIVSVTVVSPRMGTLGWPFANIDNYPGADVDPLYKSEHVKDLYFKADPDYEGRFSVPILWDKKTHTIVNNESSEIIRIFNTAFNDFLAADKATLDFYPENLRDEIDKVNDWVYANINNGVYRAGMATTQTAYEKAVVEVFEALDKVEKILDGKDYLVGNQLTEADIRLFVTTIRFDVAYVGLFKCNLRTIRDGYPAIHKWMQKLYWNNDAFGSTTDFDHIKTHYYWSLTFLNPHKVVPMGPLPNIRPL